MISWLDLLSFAFSVVAFIVAMRADWRQSRQLRSVKKKEDQIARKLDGDKGVTQ